MTLKVIINPTGFDSNPIVDLNLHTMKNYSKAFLLIVILFNYSFTFGQCVLTGNANYSSQNIKNLFKPNGSCSGETSLMIDDEAIISIAGQWDLLDLGIESLIIDGSGCLLFGNNDDVSLTESVELIITDPTNSIALGFANNVDTSSVSIAIGDSTYTGFDFASIISNGGANLFTVLPVELAEFEAIKSDDRIVLNWTTLSEKDNLGFDIEKSEDGKNWETIGFIEGHGTCLNTHNYEFVDFNNDVDCYYRLKIIATDLSEEFSLILFVASLKEIDIEVGPNPVVDYLKIKADCNLNSFELYSEQGVLVIQSEINDTATDVDMRKVQKGNYVMKLTKGNHVLYKKIIKNK